MMKRIGLLLLIAAFAASCASSDDDAPQVPQRGGGRRMPPGGGYGGEMRPAPADAGVLGLLPPPNWWHDPQISSAVKLSDSQFTALDAIAKDHASEMDRLRMETTAAERDLRLLLTADKPTANDIVTAGQRVKSDRDAMLDHELRMLADERALLTKEQWTALEDALRDERQDFRRDRGFGGPGGGRRGGWGGRRPPGT
jgi:hypothetical protein